MTRNGCSGTTTTCDGLDIRPVKLGLRPAVFPMCSGCRATASSMGVRIVERRVASIPVEVERRRFVPTWRRRLVGRDETGRLVPA